MTSSIAHKNKPPISLSLSSLNRSHDSPISYGSTENSNQEIDVEIEKILTKLKKAYYPNNKLLSVSLNYYRESISFLSHLLENTPSHIVERAFKKFIDDSIQNNFEVLFNNDFFLEQISKNSRLKNYIIEQIKIEFENTPFGKFTLFVKEDKFYSYIINLNDKILESQLKNLSNPEIMNKLSICLNEIFGYTRNKDIDSLKINFEFKLKKEGEEVSEIECKIGSTSLLNKIIDAAPFAFYTLVFLTVYFFTLFSICLISPAAIIFPLTLLLISQLPISFQTTTTKTYKLAGLPNNLLNNELKTLAHVYQEVLKKPKESNYFASEKVANLTNQEKHQLLEQWNNNFKEAMEQFFKVEEKGAVNNYQLSLNARRA